MKQTIEAIEKLEAAKESNQCVHVVCEAQDNLTSAVASLRLHVMHYAFIELQS